MLQLPPLLLLLLNPPTVDLLLPLLLLLLLNPPTVDLLLLLLLNPPPFQPAHPKPAPHSGLWAG